MLSVTAFSEPFSEPPPVRLLNQQPWARTFKPAQPPSIVCPPQGRMEGNKIHALTENQQRPPKCNPAGLGRHVEHVPQGLSVFLTCFGLPHIPWAAGALCLLVSLGICVPSTSNTTPKTASRGGIALGRGAFESSPVNFCVRVGTHVTDPRT